MILKFKDIDDDDDNNNNYYYNYNYNYKEIVAMHIHTFINTRKCMHITWIHMWI